MSHLEFAIDDSAAAESELFQDECDPFEEFAYQYDQLLSPRDRLRLEREAKREYSGERLDPSSQIPRLQPATWGTWVRLALIALFVWYTL